MEVACSCTPFLLLMVTVLIILECCIIIMKIMMKIWSCNYCGWTDHFSESFCYTLIVWSSVIERQFFIFHFFFFFFTVSQTKFTFPQNGNMNFVKKGNLCIYIQLSVNIPCGFNLWFYMHAFVLNFCGSVCVCMTMIEGERALRNSY